MSVARNGFAYHDDKHWFPLHLTITLMLCPGHIKTPLLSHREPLIDYHRGVSRSRTVELHLVISDNSTTGIRTNHLYKRYCLGEHPNDREHVCITERVVLYRYQDRKHDAERRRKPQ